MSLRAAPLLLSFAAALLAGSDPARAEEPAGVRADVVRARLAEALGQLAPLRMQMLEFYAMEGRWPASPSELGLREHELMSSVIAAVRFDAGGALTAQLRSELGAGRYLRLAPRAEMSGTSIAWDCEANFPRAVLRTLSCESAEAR